MVVPKVLGNDYAVTLFLLVSKLIVKSVFRFDKIDTHPTANLKKNDGLL